MKSSGGASESERCVVCVKPRSTQHTEHYAKCELTCDFEQRQLLLKISSTNFLDVCTEICVRGRDFFVGVLKEKDRRKIGGIDRRDLFRDELDLTILLTLYLQGA